MNERIQALRDRAMTTYWGPAPEWGRLREESLSRTAGEPELIRQAKALVYAWQHRNIDISPRELLVGTPVHVCYGDTPVTPVCFGRQAFALPWFPVDMALQGFFRCGMVSMAGNHSTMDYDGMMAAGFEGLLDRIAHRNERLLREEPTAGEKHCFLDALAIVARGYIAFTHRYADLARTMAGETTDPVRRQELLVIADHCHRVPARAPRSFREACQSAWFAFMFMPDAPGRLDQYLQPFYAGDRARGVLTREDAAELLGCLWVKYFEYAGARQAVSALYHMTLGGVRPDGSDASSDLTHLCLEVTEELCLQRPQIGLRWNRNTPPELLSRAVRVLRTRCGNPDFCNDEQIIPALVHTGIRLEDARDFSLSGCHEVIITGRAQMGSVEGFINLPKILRLLLGLEPDLGPGVDLARLSTFDLFWEALESVMGRVAADVHRISVARDSHEAKSVDLCTSLVVNDCIEQVKGYTQGGARYNHCNWDTIGIANLADSLEAIRLLVYEDGVMTLTELVAVLRSDWQGQESLRRRILREFPHFGNDDDRVDATAARLVERFADIMKRHTPFRGGQYILGTTAGGENMHIEFGRLTGATPDGRTSGAPLADSMGAAQGRDRRGVTALLNSVSRLPHRLLPTAATLNVKLDPKLIDSDEGVEKIAALIRAHFLSGGQQIQFNLVNREMLLDARAHPERHGGLMVRVAGYCAPFSSLWADLQDEIIARTEHKA